MKAVAAVLAILGAFAGWGMTMFTLTIVWARDSNAQLNNNELAAIPWVLFGWVTFAGLAYGIWLGLQHDA